MSYLKLKQALKNLGLEFDNDHIRRNFVALFIEMYDADATPEELWELCNRVGIYSND